VRSKTENLVATVLPHPRELYLEVPLEKGWRLQMRTLISWCGLWITESWHCPLPLRLRSDLFWQVTGRIQYGRFLERPRGKGILFAQMLVLQLTPTECKAPHHSRASWMKFWRRHKHELNRTETDDPLPQPPEKKMRYSREDDILLAKYFLNKPAGISDQIFQAFGRLVRKLFFTTVIITNLVHSTPTTLGKGGRNITEFTKPR
jgi:hypothetical protein